MPYRYYALFPNQTFQEVITWQARINNKINELNPTGKNNFKLIKDWRGKTNLEQLVAPSKEPYEEDHEIDGNNEDIEIIGTKKKNLQYLLIKKSTYMLFQRTATIKLNEN